MTTSYQIEQGPDGRWVIIDGSAADPKVWCGSHWSYLDQRDDQPVTSFADRGAAEHYAKTILGER